MFDKIIFVFGANEIKPGLGLLTYDKFKYENKSDFKDSRTTSTSFIISILARPAKFSKDKVDIK